jgi:hypothetical protein
MILAHGKLPRMKIPAWVKATAKGVSIETTGIEVPMGADCWIGCRHAWPHLDSGYDIDEVFLTLSVVSRHVVGDAECAKPQADAFAGTLFVVDPHTAHWLMPSDYWVAGERAKPWIGLQWEVKRKNAPAVARDIVETIYGRWCIEDDRYRGWDKP